MTTLLRLFAVLVLIVASSATASPRMLLTLGDSLGAGGPILGTTGGAANPNWTEILQTRRIGTPKALSANVGAVGGSVPDETLTLFNATYKGKGYTHAVLITGTNRLAQGGSAAEVLASINAIISALQADTSGSASGINVTVLTVPPRGGSSPWDSTKEAQRLALRTSLLALTGVTVVDLEAMAGTGNPVEMAAAYRTSDMLHFNGTPVAGGSVKVADLIDAAVSW